MSDRKPILYKPAPDDPRKVVILVPFERDWRPHPMWLGDAEACARSHERPLVLEEKARA